MGKVKDFLVASGMVSGGVGGHVLARRMGVRPCDRGGNGHAATAAAARLGTIPDTQNVDVWRVCVLSQAQNPFIAGGLPGAIAGTVVFLFIGRALDRAALQRHYARSKWEGVPKEDDESTSS